MNYRFPYKAHFQRSVAVYLALIALLTTGYVFLIKSKSALRKYQKFNLFVSVSQVETEPLREKIKSYVDEEVVKEVVINAVNPALTSYYTLYSTFGLEDADVLILEKKSVYQNDLKSRFLSFDADSKFYSADNYVYEDAHYGLLAKGVLSDCISYQEEGEYYLFVNKKSEHLLELGESGKSSSVLSFLKGVYGYED